MPFLPRHSFRGVQHPGWKGGRITVRGGYVRVIAPDHARADSHGYVFEHLMVAEAALGRPLPEGAQVHHVNGQTGDNRSCNLVICPDNAYHSLLHVRLDALRACGNPNWRKCKHCGEWDEPAALTFRRQGNNQEHPACRRAYETTPEYRQRRNQRLAAKRGAK